MRNLIAESTDAATRLVAVKAVGRVFVVRRFGIDRILKMQGIASSLGVVGAQLAKAEHDKRETERQIEENVAVVAATGTPEQAEHERAQLQQAVQAAAGSMSVEDQIRLYVDEVFPLVQAAVSHIGELQEDADVDGLLDPSTRPEDVCNDLAEDGEPATFVMPVTLTLDEDGDPAKGELPVWTFGPHVIAFGNAVIEAATDFRTVSLPPRAAHPPDHRGQVGEAVRPTPLRAALGSGRGGRGR